MLYSFALIVFLSKLRNYKKYEGEEIGNGNAPVDIAGHELDNICGNIIENLDGSINVTTFGDDLLCYGKFTVNGSSAQVLQSGENGYLEFVKNDGITNAYFSTSNNVKYAFNELFAFNGLRIF